MNCDLLIEKLKSTRPALEAKGVTHIALFGSRARGDFRPESDVDILLEVEPQSRFNLLDLGSGPINFGEMVEVIFGEC